MTVGKIKNCILLLLVACLLPLGCKGNNEPDENEPPADEEEIIIIDPLRYEAEDAALTLDAKVEKNMSGYSGSGYVNQNGGDLIFKVTIAQTGKYKLNIRYTTGNQKKENYLLVNNKQLASVHFDPVGEWSTTTINKVYLNKGENTITIKKGWGWMLFDYIEIATAGKEIPFNITSELVTPDSSPEAVKLYKFLKENFGKKVISGAMANYNTGLEESFWMYEQTGKWPALTGFDFIDYTRKWDFIDYNVIVDNSRMWWKNNGIVTIMWHWRDPLRNNDQFYTEKTDFDISKINDRASDEYKAMISDIDMIAVYLKQLKNYNIPVLWRPLHEAAGGWFWWGAKGAEPCKKLWHIMYDRLVNYHQLNNLIWVWTSDAAGNALEWYPGDKYVDIIGMDIYPGEKQHGSQYIYFDKMKELYGGHKLIALSECGSIPDIDEMFVYGDIWSWIMPWNGPMTRDPQHNGPEFISAVMKNPKIVTRDKMPSLK